MEKPTTAELIKFLNDCASDAMGMEEEDRRVLKEAAHRLEAAEADFKSAGDVLILMGTDDDESVAYWLAKLQPILDKHNS